MLFSVLLFVGCAKQTMVLSSQPYDQVPVISTSQFFLSGVGQEDLVDGEKICPKGVGKVSTIRAPKDIAWSVGLSALTGVGGWIYTPRTWEIYCIK